MTETHESGAGDAADRSVAEGGEGDAASGDGGHGWVRISGWVLVSAAVIAVGVVAFQRINTPEVEGVEAQSREVVRTLVVAGRARAPQQARLGPSIPGIVSHVAVQEGATVTSGQLVARLDDREATARMAQAEARLRDVQAAVADEIRRAEAEYAQAQRDAERIRAVVAEGGLTQQRLEQAVQRLGDASSRLDALRAQGAGDPERGGEVGSNPRVAEAHAAVEAARAHLAAHAIRAPFGGTVLERFVEPGAAVQPGAAMMSLASAGPVELVAYPAEENAALIAEGASARVSADAYPEDVFDARVTRVAPSIDEAQGTVEIRMEAVDDVPPLRPGMTLSVNLELERRRAAVTLPASAVRGLATDSAWVADVRDGRVERRPVRLGVRGDVFVEVLEGLEASRPVVLEADAVEPGDRVRLRPER